MARAAVKTGMVPTVLVAIEQNFPKKDRIIRDDLAYSILPFAMRGIVWLTQISSIRNWVVGKIEKNAPGTWGGLLCRKRYIDEKLFNIVSEVDAVVNLGAGFDTRIYRVPGSIKSPAWEVDHNENIKPKQSRLNNLFGQIPNHIQLVPLDFDHDDLSSVLSANGYSNDQQTFFIWEAVSQFLTEQGIRTTFNFLAKAAQGSYLAFTYVLKDFLNGDNLYRQEKLYQQCVEKKIWLFGLYPREVASFLKPYGWRIVEHHSYDDLAKKYIEPTGRNLPSLSVERIVFAEKT